ncbi:MAG: hypothetical protein GXO39_04885, partial [Thermotogae bacterium]|nr:hypothetical protein [Thermotogota bacterium]
DTCQFLPGERVPYMDEDWDGFVDSLYYDTTYATLVSVSGDTAEVHISPATFGKVFTSVMYSGDTMICCQQEIYEYYLRFKYVYGVGMVFLSIDSLIVYSAFKTVDTITWDTTVVPPTLVGKFNNYQLWRYTTVGVLERAGRPVGISVRGRLLKVEEDAEVFGADGRLVVILDRGQSVLLRPGVYFVRMRRGTVKVVVR